MKLEEMTTKFEEFLSTPEYGYHQRIKEIADAYPQDRSLVVDFTDLDMYDCDLAMVLLGQANNATYAANQAIKRLQPPDKDVDIHFRVKNLPRDSRVEIRNLRSKHLGRFIAVEGLVRKATEVKPKLTDAVFQCLRCSAVILEAQEGLFFKEPLECYKDQGGCGRTPASTRFKLMTSHSHNEDHKSEASTFVDTQKIEIQEFPEGLRGGAQPQRLVAYSEDDLTGLTAPGDRLVIIGTLRSTQKSYPTKSTLFDIFLDINYIEMEEHEFEEIAISAEEEEEILTTSRDPDIYRKIMASISPSIYGMNYEKEALALQLFGGVHKVMPDGTRIRGDIHILMVGDPGTAKSQLLRYMSELAPRGIYASGKSSSSAGLTAAAVKDEFGEGRWTLEAGALVLADKGLAAVDELDKMTSQDRSSLHEAMEQQRISVAKAGITATLQSRCSLLAAANPRYGRFDEHSYIADQINLPPALLSRFDLIFSVTDKPESGKDTRIAEHILQSHLIGGIRRQQSEQERLTLTEEESELLERSKPYFNRDFLRKYVAYAKKRVFPVLTPEATRVLKDYYISIRREGEAEGASVPITARQLEAFVRLSEASARMRLNDVVTEDDAMRAIRIVEYYLKKVAGEEGRFDIDIIATGHSHSQRERIRTIRDIISRLAEGGESVEHADIIAEAEAVGIERSRVEAIIRKFHIEEGWIYEVRTGSGKYRVANL